MSGCQPPRLSMIDISFVPKEIIVKSTDIATKCSFIPIIILMLLSVWNRLH